MFEFEGTDFGKKKGSTFITLPKRERKKQTYDVNQYFKETFGEDGNGKEVIKDPRKAKIPRMDDFQFFNKDRIEKIYELEYQWELERRHKHRALKERRKAEKKEVQIAERRGETYDMADIEKEGNDMEAEVSVMLLLFFFLLLVFFFSDTIFLTFLFFIFIFLLLFYKLL